MSALPPSGSHGDPDHAAAGAPRPDGSRVVRMEPRHHAEVLELNRRDVDVLSPMDEERLSWIVARCAVPLVVEDDEGVLGFCLALESGTDYDGVHYAWFGARYDAFLYLDRIAVSDRARRRGVGTRLYVACESHAATLGRMVCEVNVVPENTTSLAFHGARDYVPVGRVPVGPPGDEHAKVVAMLAKELRAAD
ncbi:GNAT family N-acetyltransferase [Patulibacter minatonensis]|uniref:GNAT family N-acetyltransferase n=1 Tax=Patulibacter minatonensis TaxID=298163 RepID=UPI000684F87A|nr:GNAT family N-acetyltransferase [Patulibacter minatonensis]